MAGRTTLIAAFTDRTAAQCAVDELEQAGFAADDVGYALRGTDAVQGGMITDAAGAKDRRGGLAGMAAGAGVGAAVGAASAMLVPGVGPVLAAGVLAMALGGAAAGTAVGGIIGALSGLEVSEAEARFYEHEFASGRAIVAVRAGARVCEAAEILRRHGGYDLENRAAGAIPTEGVFSEP